VKSHELARLLGMPRHTPLEGLYDRAGQLNEQWAEAVLSRSAPRQTVLSLKRDQLQDRLAQERRQLRLARQTGGAVLPVLPPGGPARPPGFSGATGGRSFPPMPSPPKPSSDLATKRDQLQARLEAERRQRWAARTRGQRA
jgi:hypothetical protein